MDDRVELKIDVFEETGQVAKVLRTLTIRELIEEILVEFDELSFLDRQSPWNYTLRRKDEDAPLDPTQTVADHHLSRGTELVLEESPTILPGGATVMPENVYLLAQSGSDLEGSRVFKLNWNPAIIGRPDTNLPNNDLLAVDLQPFPSGLRVSRRHARINEKDGRYFLESLSNNPTQVNDDAEPLVGTRELQEGDDIHLVRSGIVLKFISR